MPDDARGSSGGGLSALVRLAFMLLLGGAVALPLASQPARPGGGADSSSASSAAKSGSSAQKGPKTPDSGPHTDALVLLGEFAGLDVTDDALKASRKDATPDELEGVRLDLVRNALSGKGIQVQFLIATVPDPINSNARWTFDPVVTAINRAAAASGFLLDRFFIPDWSPESDGDGEGTKPRTTHERWPGVIVFRSAGFMDKAADKRLLVTSLVFETPTAGIHQEAFAEAVHLASLWRSSAVIPVLGPTFSGSSFSLSNAMSASEFKNLQFRVVTGSATDRRNLSIASDPRISFASTVLPDDAVVPELVTYLQSTGSGSDRFALLVEGNTSYGSELKGRTQAGKPQNKGPWPDGTRFLPFPLQISRLRSAAAQARPNTAAAGNTGRLLGFSLGQSGATTDQIPSMTPDTTSSGVELELGQILDVIARDHITTVGLLATDTRDKLFLAQQIARRTATVRLFTIESDLFYVHPDYRQYVRGMVVASSYPLFVQNQRWLDGALANQQFSTTMAQGVYNAMVTLLNYDRNGDVAAEGTNPGLLDYRCPGTAILHPPVWIGVVGSDAIWPVSWSCTEKGEGYVHRIQGGASPGDPVAYVSAWTVFAVGALGAFVLLHVIPYACRSRLATWEVDGWPFFKFFSPSGIERRRPYLFTAFAVLGIAWGYVCALMVLSVLYLSPSRLGPWPDFVGFGVSVAVLLSLLLSLVSLALHTTKGVWLRVTAYRDKLVQPQYLLLLVAFLAALLAGGAATAYLLPILGRADRAVYYFQRATHPGNGVSPTLPLMLVAALVYLWAFAHLRRLSNVSGALIEKSLRPLAPLAGDALLEPVVMLRKFIDAAVQALPHPLTGAVLATALISGYLAWLHPLSSPEPRAFTWAFRAAWLVLQILLWLAFAHIAYFWHMLRRAMHAFAGTPMIGAFGRLSPELFHDRLSPRQPDEADIRRMTFTARQLGLALIELKKPEYGRLKKALLRVASKKATATKKGASWAESDEWERLCVAMGLMAEKVAESWTSRPRATVFSSIDIDAEVKDAKDAKVVDKTQLWLMRAEELLALHVLVVVRELLSRLANVFFYVIVAVVLMVAIQQSFPFQPRQELLGMAWIYVLSAVLLVLTIVVQMEHDDVLSAFASTKSGKMNWDAALWSKVFIYGVIPLATVFAAQFPGIGTTLLDWLTPVQKALP